MVGVKVNFDTKADIFAGTAFQKIREGDYSIPLRRIGAVVAGDIQQGMINQVSPDGTPYKPLSPVTIKLRKRGGKGKYGPKALLDSGRLLGSIVWNLINKNSVEIGTNVEYARVQQEGGPSQMLVIKKKNKKIKTGKKAGKYKKGAFATAYYKTIQVPPRPFVGVSQRASQLIAKTLEDWLREN